MLQPCYSILPSLHTYPRMTLVCRPHPVTYVQTQKILAYLITSKGVMVLIGALQQNHVVWCNDDVIHCRLPLKVLTWQTSKWRQKVENSILHSTSKVHCFAWLFFIENCIRVSSSAQRMKTKLDIHLVLGPFDFFTTMKERVVSALYQGDIF